MISSVFILGKWPYAFMNMLSSFGLLMFFGISFLLYVALYYIGKMLSHLRWGGNYRLLFIVSDGFFYRATEACERRLNLHLLYVVFNIK